MSKNHLRVLGQRDQKTFKRLSSKSEKVNFNTTGVHASISAIYSFQKLQHSCVVTRKFSQVFAVQKHKLCQYSLARPEHKANHLDKCVYIVFVATHDSRKYEPSVSVCECKEWWVSGPQPDHII